MTIGSVGTESLDQVRQMEVRQVQRAAQRMQKKSVLQRDDTALKEACRQFEAIFVKQMLNSMRKTVNRSGLIDGGFSEEIFEDMLYDEYADKMTKTAGLGIADILYRQFTDV